MENIMVELHNINYELNELDKLKDKVTEVLCDYDFKMVLNGLIDKKVEELNFYMENIKDESN